MNNEKVYLKGYVVGHSADTLGYKGLQIQLENMDILEVDKNLVYKNIDEPQLLKLKDVIKRIEKFDLATKAVWINEILNKLGSDYGLHKYHAGYKQGKFDGAIEREKVTIPQFVADWIKYCKNINLTMTRALIVDEVDFYNYANQKDESRLIDFLRVGKNQEIFARAWLDGYKVEEEKRYRVRIKGVYYNSCLIFDKINKKWFLSSIFEIDHQMGSHTRKELEDAGFGWVFDCPGIEIEEVEG